MRVTLNGKFQPVVELGFLDVLKLLVGQEVPVRMPGVDGATVRFGPAFEALNLKAPAR